MAPTKTTPTDERFPHDAARESYVAGLVRERDGYKARSEAAESRGDSDQVDYLKGRVSQVDAQLKELGEKATTAAKRAEKRAQGADEVDEDLVPPHPPAGHPHGTDQPEEPHRVAREAETAQQKAKPARRRS